MPTRGRFVCHVHCLVHDGAVQSSPCGPHHKNFGRNLYRMYLFRLILQVKSFVLFYLWYSSCFEVKCWIHTFHKRCSHIAMRILIPLIIEIVMSTIFQTGVFLSKWSRSFSTFARSILSFLNGVSFIRPKLSLFSRPPTLFLQGLRFLNHVSFYLWEVSSLFSFNVLIRWFPMKMLNSFKFIILHSRLLFWWIQFKLSVLIIFLSSCQMLSHVDAPLNCSPLAIHVFQSVEDISEDLCVHS